jgi:hypothetical protein
LYKNAEIASQYTKFYNKSPNGLSRPDYTIEVQAMMPVAEKRMPLIIPAGNTRNIYKSLELKEELDFNMVLVEANQITPAIKEIKAAQVAVMLSLDFPELPKKEKDAKSDDAKVEEKEKKDKPEEKSEERIALEKRKAEAFEETMRQAALLAEHNIPFAFSFTDVKIKNIHPNLRALKEYGLNEKQILEAMTLQPANILGISKITGSIEPGKLANLMICDKNYFDEKSKIKFVVTEGQLFEVNSKKVEKAQEVSNGNGKWLGTWNYKVEVFGQAQTGKIVIELEDGKYKIKSSSDQSPSQFTEAESITVNDKKLKFSLFVDAGGGNVDVDFLLDMDDSAFDGTVSVGEFGSFPVSGELIDPKN